MLRRLKNRFFFFVSIFLRFVLNFRRSNISFLSYVDRSSKISPKARIHAFGKIRNSMIGDYTYVSHGASVNNTKIGKFCSIGCSFKSGLGMHPIDFVSTSPVFYSNNNALGFSFVNDNFYKEYSNICIGNDVWIGADVMILDGVQIGDGAIVAAKSLVNKDVPPFAIVGGVPAKVLRYRFDEKTIKELLRLKWWNFPIEKLSLIAKEFTDVENFSNGK